MDTDGYIDNLNFQVSTTDSGAMLETTSEDFHQEVCQKFKTSLQQLRQDVKVLREWIKQQPHLPQCASDTLLTTFLVACKNRMERAKEKIDNYYTARLEIPDFFKERDPESEPVQRVSEEIRLFTLPKMTPDGCRVTMMSFVTGDVTKYNIPAFCKRLMAHEDVKFEQESFLMGDYFVLDGQYFSMSHVFKLTPSLARNYIHCSQEVLPVIIKGVVIINAPSFMELVINLLKPFMKGKLLQKFHIHSEGPDILERYFPKRLLPCDYGGEEESRDVLNEAWLRLLCQKKDWLLNEGSMTVDETKRVSRPHSTRGVGLQQLQGSFKTLCVD